MFLGSTTDGRPLYDTPTEFASVKKSSLQIWTQLKKVTVVKWDHVVKSSRGKNNTYLKPAPS